jgi:segregation and condensation protein B
MDLKLILEAVLFTSQKPLSPAELRDVLSRAAVEEGAAEPVRALGRLDPDRILATLRELAAEHEAAARSYRLVCVAGAWQFVTEPSFAPWLRALLGVKARPSRLSQPALETLAIIAYRQPITRAEMEQIRGVAVDGVLSSLVERGLIFQAGRAEVVGRPMQFATTPTFLEYFGLGSLEDLPDASELRRIPVQRPDSLLTVDPHLATAPPDATAAVPADSPMLGLSLEDSPSAANLGAAPGTEPAPPATSVGSAAETPPA